MLIKPLVMQFLEDRAMAPREPSTLAAKTSLTIKDNRKVRFVDAMAGENVHHRNVDE